MAIADRSGRQRLEELMDNHWLLLVVGVLIPFISYNLWGWIDLILIKPAQLP